MIDNGRIPIPRRLLFLRGFLLLLALVVVAAAEDYGQVIVSFEMSEDCTESMFPPQWTRMIEQGLDAVGINYEKWTHGYDLDRNGGDGRYLQANSGCPDWCRYLTQYCECLCVTTCDDDDDQTDDQTDDGGETKDNNANGNSNGNSNNGNANGNGNRRRRHLRANEEERLRIRQAEIHYDVLVRRTSVAQFVLDEQTLQDYIGKALRDSEVTIDCMAQQPRVFLINN